VRQAVAAQQLGFFHGAHEVDHQAHRAQRFAHDVANLAPGGQHQHMAAGQRL
jgi:hypothetical protein